MMVNIWTRLAHLSKEMHLFFMIVTESLLRKFIYAFNVN